MPDFVGLYEWSFINTHFAEHAQRYEALYHAVLIDTRERLHREPSAEDVITNLSTALFSNDYFWEYCQATNPYKSAWAETCSKEFARFLISNFYEGK